jgi:hypothetical protein
LRVFVRLLIVVVVTTAAALATVGTTASQTVSFTADLTLATAQGSPGQEFVVATFNVPPEFQGLTCPTNFTSTNNVSTHPGNALILTSAGGSITLENVEDTANTSVPGSGNITLGPGLTVTMRLGPDGESSGGAAVGAFTCTPTTTTTAPPVCVAPNGQQFPVGSPECEVCISPSGQQFPIGSPECQITVSPAIVVRPQAVRFTG